MAVEQIIGTWEAESKRIAEMRKEITQIRDDANSRLDEMDIYIENPLDFATKTFNGFVHKPKLMTQFKDAEDSLKELSKAAQESTQKCFHALVAHANAGNPEGMAKQEALATAAKKLSSGQQMIDFLKERREKQRNTEDPDDIYVDNFGDMLVAAANFSGRMIFEGRKLMAGGIVREDAEISVFVTDLLKGIGDAVAPLAEKDRNLDGVMEKLGKAKLSLEQAQDRAELLQAVDTGLSAAADVCTDITRYRERSAAAVILEAGKTDKELAAAALKIDPFLDLVITYGRGNTFSALREKKPVPPSNNRPHGPQ